MNQRQAVGGVAVATHSRLGDAPAIHLHAGAVGAHLALEERLLHLRDKLRGADHHAADGDQLIDVCGRNTEADTSLFTKNRRQHCSRNMCDVSSNLLGSGSSCFWFSRRCRGVLGSDTQGKSRGNARRKAR